MALFDQFGQGQAGNGQSPPNLQQTQGAPGFQFGSWGNHPQGPWTNQLQQFLQQRGQQQGLPQSSQPAPPGSPPVMQPGGGPPPGPPQGAPMPPQPPTWGGMNQTGGGGGAPTMPMQGGVPRAPTGPAPNMFMGGNPAGGLRSYLGR